MFSERDYSSEIMDDFSIQDERIDAALKELKVINKFLGGNAVTRNGFNKLINSGNTSAVKILDAGSGGSDVFTKLKSKYSCKVVSVDINKRACIFVRNKGTGEIPVCADVKSLPFKENSFDITHCSLLLHHFRETEILDLINSFMSVSRLGIIINDLRRSVPAYLGIKLLTRIFSGSEMVKHDGPLSVKRGFRFKELTGLMDKLNIRDYTLKRKWAFRWLLVIYSK